MSEGSHAQHEELMSLDRDSLTFLSRNRRLIPAAPAGILIH
jgi:hypothetical protein